MWKQLRKKAKTHGVSITTVVLGDTLDKNKYSKNGVFAHNPNNMLQAAARVLKPAIKASERVYIVRGTPAHDIGSWDRSSSRGLPRRWRSESARRRLPSITGLGGIYPLKLAAWGLILSIILSQETCAPGPPVAG